MSYLQIKNLTFSYLNGPVVRDIGLNIEEGERLAILGPNGCGKTTLLKLIAGLLKPDKGQIMLNGESLKSLPRREIARQIAVVPQQFYMPFAFTVEEIVLLGRTPYFKAFSEDTPRDHRIVEDVIEKLNIAHLKHRLFNELSGGERQKVILAMALSQQPRLIVLDEPTTHLDINHQTEILDLLVKLNNGGNLTVIAAMHDLNIAALYFQRMVLLKEGCIFAEGTPHEVIKEETVNRVFSTNVKVNYHSGNGLPYILILPRN